MTEFDLTNSLCADLGRQYAGIMFSVASDPQERRLAESLGLTMEKNEEGTKITVTISTLAATTYIDNITGNSLGFIIEEIQRNRCATVLNLSIAKVGSDIQIIQKINI